MKRAVEAQWRADIKARRRKYVRLVTFQALLGVSRSTLWRYQKRYGFPASVRMAGLAYVPRAEAAAWIVLQYSRPRCS